MLAPYIRLVLRHPGVLPAAVRLAWRVRRRGWYRRFPFLPLPSAHYLRWRSETAFGEGGGPPSADELRRYLLWAKRFRRHD